ncbi:uncharacterized protein LOC122078118 [Macadamia integrifolia]|uniref:uncharacterized protein LOC122078118 n=1 Tax=Macadamia integrifolia TaxID=60698 RepID=UPI001C4F2078|nr:uncharacterized protein LOC122078118 [Macadamia integrifolia]
MSGLSKLGTGLTVVFLVCLLLLLAEISYVFWCRRRFRQQNATVESDASGEPYSTSTTTTTTSSSPSKELIYFSCWKKQSRIEPATAPTAPATTDQENPSPEIDNPLKWHVLYGQSRLLFTIKEEDREDLESEKSSSAERNPNPINPKRKRVSLGDCFEITKEDPPVESLVTEKVSVVLDVENLQTESTPFMTPCASPSSGSPSPSPPSVAGENKREEGLQLA